MIIKHIHQATALITISLFVVRGYWMITNSPRLGKPWVKILPHVNDTVLLGSAILLAYTTQQYPLRYDWLSAKVLALLLYIGLGMVALSPKRSKPVKITAWVSALAVVVYIVFVALTKQPWPFRI